MGPGDPWLRLGWRCSALPGDMGTSQPPRAAQQPPRRPDRGRWLQCRVLVGCHRGVTAAAQPRRKRRRSRQGDGPRGDPRWLLPHWMSPVGSSELTSVLVEGAAPLTPGSTAPHRSEPGEGRSMRVKPKLGTNPQGQGEPCSPEGLLLTHQEPGPCSPHPALGGCQSSDTQLIFQSSLGWPRASPASSRLGKCWNPSRSADSRTWRTGS